MRWTIVMTIACSLAATHSERAMAISTLQDTLQGLPQIFRLPSTVPPNNAVHEHFLRPHPHSDPNSDEGPHEQHGLVTIPASSTPWTVAISESTDLSRGFVCAGVLVDPAWVLTAAHCLFSVARRWPNDSDLYVFVESPSLSSPGRKFPVEEIVPHPEYDARALRNDLALVRIDTRQAKPGAPLPFEGPPISELIGGIGTILGWGITTTGHVEQHNDKLQILQVAILDDEVCFSPVNFPQLRGTGVFCATSLLKYHDVCLRFGGSPMAIYSRKGALYLAGMVSWAANCPADSRKPNVYLDIHAYAPWIRSVLGSKTGRLQ
jgi:secreted trypsin-like serine protease